jgi:alkanesulfonate monooxygenase
MGWRDRHEQDRFGGRGGLSTCPPFKGREGAAYLQQVADVARWSEQAGCRGILVYSDNGLVDPWLVSQPIIQATEALCPLVAVQPVYMHPYSAAKMVATLGQLHGRRVYLNMLAGGFKNDLVALNDTTPHDERYERTVEYTLIVKRLLFEPAPVSFAGRYYQVHNLKLTPSLPEHLLPGMLISGSSPAGLAAARAIGATAVQYPEPAEQMGEWQRPDGVDVGIRVGIIARDTAEAAWDIAHRRFPEDRKGQLAHQLATKVSDSHWHHRLSELGEGPTSEESPYWLGPFQNYKTFCPYLVGSYGRVAEELAKYVGLGFRTFILDIPPSKEELDHIGIVFREALGAERR